LKGIAAYRAAGGQVVAAFGDDDARPQHAGRVPQIKAVGQHQALLDLGDAGFVAGFGGALAGQGVDEGGLADVGNAADQHPHGLDHGAARGRQRVAGVDQAARGRGFAGVQLDGAGVGQAVVVVQPERRARGVGQVAFVEHLERGLAAGQLGQHGVGAGAGQARVQQLNDDINFLDALTDGFFGQVHVTGKPLDGHLDLFFLGFGCSGAWGGAPCDTPIVAAARGRTAKYRRQRAPAPLLITA
jgi:hypothetical protein